MENGSTLYIYTDHLCLSDWQSNANPRQSAHVSLQLLAHPCTSLLQQRYLHSVNHAHDTTALSHACMRAFQTIHKGYLFKLTVTRVAKIADAKPPAHSPSNPHRLHHGYMIASGVAHTNLLTHNPISTHKHATRSCHAITIALQTQKPWSWMNDHPRRSTQTPSYQITDQSSCLNAALKNGQ